LLAFDVQHPLRALLSAKPKQQKIPKHENIMCKLIAMSTAACKNTRQASRLVLKMSTLLAASQRDGFGYAIKTSDGVFSERYLDPKTCEGMGELKASRDLLPASLKTQLSYGVDYDQQGIIPSKGAVRGSVIAHGRTATCGKNITNTHPFTGCNDGQQWTIAHNGVVEWTGESLPLQTTCDSEHILNCYLYKQGEQSFHEGLAGYAAVVGINPQGEMFALRDDRAPLYVSYVKQLGCYILCTDSTHCEDIADLISDFNGLKNSTVTNPMMIAPYVRHTFHASGEITSVAFPKFKSTMSYSSTASVYRSLGSAGAVGYASSAWDDEYTPYRAPIATSPATQPTLPSIPSTERDMGDDAEQVSELETLRQQRLTEYRRNRNISHKPWKHGNQTK
jgi:hypothetical protein